MDTNISIFYYIKNGAVSVKNEIVNIRANLSVNILVKQFFMNSIEYQKLYSEIHRKTNQLKRENKNSRKLHLAGELNKLLEIEKEFKIDVLRLADVFSKLEITTQRLQKAKDLFEQGRFREADAILIESELSNDQYNLLIQVEYLENKRDGFLTIFKSN